jgi:tetratricopeptide (TPR) repeat protein
MKFLIILSLFFTNIYTLHSQNCKLESENAFKKTEVSMEIAIAELSKTIKKFSDCHYAYYYRSMCYGTTGHLDKALNDINNALIVKPKSALYYDTRGAVYKSLGQLQKAIQDFTKSISLCTNTAICAMSYTSRGQIKRGLGDLKGAKEDFAESNRLDPNNYAVNFELAAICYEMKDWKKAIKYYTSAINVLKSQSKQHTATFVLGTVYYNRGLAYKEMNNLSSACSDWGKSANMGDLDAIKKLKAHCQ